MSGCSVLSLFKYLITNKRIDGPQTYKEKKRAAAFPGWMLLVMSEWRRGQVLISVTGKTCTSFMLLKAGFIFSYTLQFFLLHNICFITTWL